MAWPPPVLPINRTNATPQQDMHAADHNAVNQAVNDIVTEVSAIKTLNTEVRHVLLSMGTGTYLTPTRRNLQVANMGTRGFNRMAVVTCGVLFQRTGGTETHFDLWIEGSAPGLVGYPTMRTRATIAGDSYGGAVITGVWGIPANAAAVFTPSLSASYTEIYAALAGGDDLSFINVITTAAPGSLSLLP